MASSLDEALARIVGTPGAQAGATPAATPIASAPAGQTTVALGGTPPPPAPAAPVFTPDPALAATQAQIDANNRAIAALIAPAPAPAPAVSTAASAPVAPAAPAYDFYNTARYVTGNLGQPATLSVGTAGGQFTPVTRQNARDAQIRAQLERSVAGNQAALAGVPASAAGAVQESIGAMQGYLNQPIGGREFLTGKGLTPQAFRAMARPERQALRGEYQGLRAMNPVAAAMNQLTA